MTIHIDTELESLQQSWSQVQESWSVALQESALRLNRRIEFNTHRPSDDWPRRFSPLTALYPLLQAESICDDHRDEIRNATLGHFHLLVHSILDDRLLDQQYAFVPADQLLNKRLFIDGYRLLEKCSASNSDEFDRRFNIVLGEYEEAQEQKAEIRVACNGPDLAFSKWEAVAAGRAAFGRTALLALECRFEISLEMARDWREAFDLLAVALQWVDDAEDWEEDWLAGGENLLIQSLDRTGHLMTTQNRTSASLPELQNRLMKEGIVSEALRTAIVYLERAEEIQIRLSCPVLAGEIAWFRVRVADKLTQLGRGVQAMLIESLLA